jgi:1-aminocyclopropane-1-carboxylate deaminase/D-cysteine desulfhydrase-like pyridoxal-dependent ACC family enzyme
VRGRLDQGCDTLVTGGGVQSNHVRMTTAAANRLGLACTIVLAGDPSEPPSGNVLLDRILGADLVWIGRREALDYYEVEKAIEDTCRSLAATGRKPYGMPIGGASSVGALGYVQAALELRDQDPDIDLVVVADGSGGTHAGLVAGLGEHRQVLGIDVGARPDLDEQVPKKAAEVAELAGVPPPKGGRQSGAAQIDHDHAGERYGAVTTEALAALRLAARLEGLLLDPVYTGKAMAGLITACRQGRIAAGRRVAFLHTGGFPALFASPYSGWLAAPPATEASGTAS